MGDDNELMREFTMKIEQPELSLLQPFPDFGFNNDLHFVEKDEMSNFWHIISDFIFK